MCERESKSGEFKMCNISPLCFRSVSSCIAFSYRCISQLYSDMHVQLVVEEESERHLCAPPTTKTGPLFSQALVGN